MQHRAACGTEAAYRRHLRLGEIPDDECRAASTARRIERKDGDRAVRNVATLMAVPAPGEPEGDATPLDDARENLAIVKVAVPREVAALSKRRQELAQLISDLAERQEPSLADQLAAIRDRRSTQISGRS